MKFNPDCVRDILIHIESFEYNSAHTIDQMCTELSNYSYEELDYHCLNRSYKSLYNQYMWCISSASFKSI